MRKILDKRNKDIRTHAGKEMPPAMQLQQETSRHADAALERGQGAAGVHVDVPQEEAEDEDEEAEGGEGGYLGADFGGGGGEACAD